MPSYTRMKTIFLQSLLWLYLLGIGCVVLSVEPGYLDFDNLPDTNFSCVGKVIGGYYADLETNCQMFHVCTIGQLDEPMDIRFLCLNGTVFDQETRVCERIDEVDCSKSEKFYSLNLELYGNTQPSIAEDNAETDPPIIIRATTTTTTTTTTQKPKPKTSYFTTPKPVVTTKVISSHHFPISSNSDIRFNPEEINISLNPGTPPDVRSQSVTYQQQVFDNDSKKVVVTTHTSYGTPDKEDFVRVVANTQRPHLVSTQKVKPQSPATPADINYGFTYHQTESGNQDYTETPHNYQYQRSNLPFRHGQFRNQFKTTTYTTTRKTYIPKEPTTFRTPYVSSLKTPTYHTYRTEKPQRLQLPIPLLPTLPPLTFSSPAPFTLSNNHIETKRYTNEHQTPPRIIISASASVSDNSGRRLNYSLGTIGVSPLLEAPPKSYDDYKDHDVVLDPFYHDVPKIKTRQKRQTNEDQAAVDVLRFLFDWYRNHQPTSTLKVPIDPEDITEINQQLAPIVETPTLENKTEQQIYKDSALFNRQSKFNIIGDILSITEAPQVVTTAVSKPATEVNLDTAGFVDDNYEAVQLNETTTEKEVEITTVPPTTTTPEPTTTSRIMALMRSRARAHHKRIMKENSQRYNSFLTNIKPKIRTRGRGRGRSTTEPQTVEETTSTVVLTASTTEAPTVLTTATSPTTTVSKVEETNEEQELGETQSLFGSQTTTQESDDQVREASGGVEVEATTVAEEQDTNALQKKSETSEGEGVSPQTEIVEPREVTEESQSESTKEQEAKTIENQEQESLKSVTEVSQDEETIEGTDHSSTKEQEARTTEIEEQESPGSVTEVSQDQGTIEGADPSSTKEQEARTTEIEEQESPRSVTEVSQDEGTIEGIDHSSTKEQEASTIVTQEPTEASQDEEISENETTKEHEARTVESEEPTNVTEVSQDEETTEVTDHPKETLSVVNETTEVPKNESQPTEEDVDTITTEVSTRPEQFSTTELQNLVSDDGEETTSFPITEEDTVPPSTEGKIILDTTTSTTEETPTLSSVATDPSTEAETTAPNLTPAEITTTETASVTRSRTPRRRTRPSRTRTSSSYRRPNSRHRFSSTEVTSRPSRRKSVIEEEIIDTLTTEEIYSTSPKVATTTAVDFSEDVPTTDAALYKSANPTQAESSKESLHTTPLSMAYKLNVRKEKLRSYIFNCFGKPINKFYSDPRDCRLFHYCTSGYNKNQLLDMKFVCDLGTFFDDEKLICTKTKPERCL